jgi:Asp-tRNA(Asn)/Glu-tRNA(Gln) amidotransferase A subunit family amidase
MPQNLPVSSLAIILAAESAAAFDQLTVTGKDDELVRQIRNAWPTRLRSSRFIPAVEYIQANRVRYQLIHEMNVLFSNYDVILAPTHGRNLVLVTNLTGHPCISIPNGFTEEGTPVSFSLLGKLFDEATILAVAKLYQEATDFEDRHPPVFE